MESAPLLWKACCLFWIRSFKCFIIQGACVFMGTFLTGIRRSRPVYITCSKTQSNSLQVLKELSHRGQSNEHRYLPVSAFWLGCRSRLKLNLSGACLLSCVTSRWLKLPAIISAMARELKKCSQLLTSASAGWYHTAAIRQENPLGSVTKASGHRC